MNILELIGLNAEQLSMLSSLLSIISILGSVAFAVFRFIIQPFIIKSPYLGLWYGYNSSKDKRVATISREVWSIHRKWLSWDGHLIVVARSSVNPQLKYIGELVEDKDANHVLINFTRRGSHEKFAFRINRTAESTPPNPLLGFWVGRDHDQQMVAGMVLVDRTPHTDEEIRAIWDANLAEKTTDYLFRLNGEYMLG